MDHSAIDRFRTLIVAKENPASVTHSARTAVVAVASLLVAYLFHLQEAYWAAITALAVMQSTLGASLPTSAQQLAGTALGAAAGALVGAYFPGNVLFFGLAVFVIGLVCAALRIERSAYRYASTTLAIVLLVPRPNSQWVIAVHRFFEVSIGIAVGLAVITLWPERKSDSPGSKGNV
jgi:uncharacterized membrane protein YgaE (UPF0421/DUF939 family)